MSGAPKYREDADQHDKGGLPSGMCSKGWGDRCARSKGPKCRCQCGGVNHGKAHGSVAGAAQNEREARFRIENFEPEQIIIRDLGPWDKHLTVTNDAENVIRRLNPAPKQRVFYDSMGQLDELVHENHAFVRFAPGPRSDVTNDGLPRRMNFGGVEVQVGDLVEVTQ